MIAIGLAIDALLAIGLAWLAWQVVAGRTLFRSIVMFIVLGLVMAVTWARLRAPDLALAEAAIGAGLSGAMFLVTFRRLLAADPAKAGRRYLRPSILALPLGLLSALFVGALGYALLTLPPFDDTATLTAANEVDRLMPGTGLANPVTGVLLLFRGYDTLLEMAVLLAAWAGLRIVQPHQSARTGRPAQPIPLLQSLLAAAVPSAVLVAGYLLYVGSRAPGGAFQAGAVLAAAGVLLALTGRLQPQPATPPPLLLGLVSGIAAFCLIGLAGSGAALALPGLWAVYLVEGAMTVSIALTLALLFLGSAGLQRDGT